LRGGADPEESVDYEKLAEQVHELVSEHPELPEFVRAVDDLTKEYIEKGRI
jgi:hypothetical protein